MTSFVAFMTSSVMTSQWPLRAASASEDKARSMSSPASSKDTPNLSDPKVTPDLLPDIYAGNKG